MSDKCRCDNTIEKVPDPPVPPPHLQRDMPELFNTMAFVVSRITKGKYAPGSKFAKTLPKTPSSDKMEHTKIGAEYEADVAYPASKHVSGANAVPYVEMSIVSDAPSVSTCKLTLLLGLLFYVVALL